MKYSIRLIALCTIWRVPVYLDLDTGETYNTKMNAEEIEKLEHKIKIPRYSRAVIQQHYLEMAREHLGFQPGEWFDRYPRFELIPEYEPEGLDEFYDKAHIAIESIPLDNFISYSEYLDELSLQLAKKWCDREGLEWYDDREESIPAMPLPTESDAIQT